MYFQPGKWLIFHLADGTFYLLADGTSYNTLPHQNPSWKKASLPFYFYEDTVTTVGPEDLPLGFSAEGECYKMYHQPGNLLM